MSEPSSFHAFHPGREREAREAEARFSNALNYTMRDPDELAKALRDYLDFKRLAAICKLATADEAQAGRQLRKYALEMAYEHSRWSSETTEEMPPLAEAEPLSLMPMMREVFAEKLGAASGTANVEPHELSVSASADEPARLRNGVRCESP